MPFIKKIKNSSGTIGIWELSETSSEILSRFHFSNTEKATFEKIKNEKRKKEFLAVRILLKKILNNKTEIGYGNNGKPKLINSRLNISISHSANLAVVLLSEKTAGIDVENIQRNIASVARRFLSEKEMKQILQEQNLQGAQILYWSAKEAIFKCSGTQDIRFNTQIIIHPFKIEKEGHFSGTLSKNENTKHYTLKYFFLQNNVIVYCVEV